MTSTANVLPRKDLFELPEGVIYLDGNSLGPVVKGTMERVQTVIRDEWGSNLIKAWNLDNWMAMPMQVGDLVGRLIGAPAGSVTMGDTLSIKVFQALSAGVKMRPDRRSATRWCGPCGWNCRASCCNGWTN